MKNAVFNFEVFDMLSRTLCPWRGAPALLPSESAQPGAGRVGRALTGLTAMLLLAACGGVSDERPPGDFERAVLEWQIVFEDNFDGNAIDSSKWNIQTGDGTAEGIPGWGNNELQSYAADNISVANGVLTIQAREDSPGVYSSGRLNSLGNFDFTYGRVEIRAKLPAGQGMWPAAWMLHSEGLYGPWPASGEIDIVEAFNPGNGNNDVAGSVHFGLDQANRTILSSTYNLGVSPDLGFHIYEVEWEKGQIRFFVDGQHFQTIKSDEWYAYFKAGADGFFDPNGAYKLGLEAAPFDQQFHLLLNLAVGGDPVGAPDATTVFPQNYEIDYVRVYQCANANVTTGRGCGRADPSVVPLENDDPLKVAGFDIFKDGPEVVEISLGQQQATNTLQVGEFNGNGTVVANDPMFTDPDDPTNTVWHVNIAGSGGVGNVFIGSEVFPEGSLLETGFDLSGGEIAGQLVFDMKVNSISGTTILIKMDSGFPDAGEVALPSPLVGEWQTYAIDISELLANPAFVDCCGGQGLDLQNVLNVFVFEVLDGDVDVYLDNISVNVACRSSSDCRAQPKGSPEDVIVFDDAVGPAWTGGIQAFDTASGGDYADPQSANKINWEVKPADDPARGNIIEVLFKDNAESGVWFITSNPGVVDLSGYADGALVFDLRVVDYDTATSMTMKVDCIFPCTSGDQLLGRVADGVWETITIPVSQLVRGGLDLTSVNTGIVVFPGFAPVGVRFQLDNIRWTLTGDIPEPTLDQIDLPVTFDDPFTDYTVIDFGDPVSASTVIGADPDDGANMVAITTKPTGAPVWAGTTIGNPNFANPIPFSATETSMSVDVRVPMAGIPIRLKVETAGCPSDGSDPTCFAELDAFPLMADTWETVSWDFSLVGIDTTQTFDRASIFFDFGTAGNDAVYYWDNVRVGAPPPPAIALVNGGFETGDFAGWNNAAGANTVGAPTVGARTGSSAAQLTSTGGGGVAEINQRFAANPGDEINFSVWTLTEAPLPAGATFGLAKIVFKDAAGNDLVPESASIGVINTDFPGIESQPFLNDASPVDTWIFSEAQGVAPAGTVEVVFLLLNVDFAGGENPMWFDDAQASLVVAPPPPAIAIVNGGFETGDLTGWTDNAGTNTVGAPAAGANGGSFAAQLTTPGGGGVAELRQTFAASEGDEVNFSVWMLTEAALPPGASFGLAKIVFKDAAGNDLVPESASIGVINTDFPGIESQPFLNDASPVNTWVFSEAQGVAPAGTTEVVFLLLNIDFAGGENPIWFDDAQASLVMPPAVALSNGGFESGDLSGWDGTPDNSVGAPTAGARSGAFAARLTTPGGSGVPELRQSFPANPGDEFYLSAWILNESAPGPTVGLVKIVFKDASGTDLLPESASIGTINTDFPGVESTPVVDGSSPLDTWIFTEAQGVAPAGTVEVVFLLLNVDFNGGENPIWFDDALAMLVSDSLALANAGFESGDFTDWTGTGDNVVGAPVAGARSGASAAQLTVTGGGGVSEISQTYPASPGDDIQLSTWMLTEAALPAGPSFGLAKIVFQDATDPANPVDLLPESASIGVINTDFPGVESQPFANDASPVDTWVYSVAQGVAPAGTTQVKLILLNVDFAGGENPIWFDDAQVILVNDVLTNEGFEAGDFTDWAGTGDNVVGAPVAGARTGASAAQLTVTGGGGVSEISQTVPALPGDEINLSTFGLTEAALPAGPSFGLAKIVFQDASDPANPVDLLPESASLGIINTDFPGVESQPFVNDASPVDTWVYSVAQGVAPVGTTQAKLILLNVDFAGGENPIWFDDAQATFVP